MSNATAAGAEVTLLGNEYVASPLRLRDLEELEIFMQGRVIAAGRASLPEDCSPEEEDKLMRPIILAASKVNAFNLGIDDLRQPSLIVRIMRLMLVQRHPDVTLEFCRKAIVDAESSKSFLRAFTDLRPKPKNPQQPLPKAGENPSIEANGSPSLVESTT